MGKIIQRRGAVLVKEDHDTMPMPEPHKADYSAPVTDELLNRIDAALEQTQEQLSKGRIVSRFAW
ncbi:MAG: hypothetical protein RL186_1748 [Pseudomonadota bacterium]|jgi:hypothetical protein